MQVLIDTTVLNAEAYYRTYLREPSPAGDISITAREITAVQDMTLHAVLTAMKAQGKGGELLVVTHSGPSGFKMPLMAGAGASAIFSVMDMLLKISQGIARRAALKNVAAARLPDEWAKWFKEFDPGVVLEPGYESNPDWRAYVEQKYDEWYQRQGQQILKLRRPVVDLTELMALLDEVRKLAFGRLEFRACRIGTDVGAMKAVAGFFNATKVVGPKEVRTFYGNINRIELIRDTRQFEQMRRRLGGRSFPGLAIAMQINPHTLRVVATDDSQAKGFITSFISSGYTGNVSPFSIGGLEPAATAVIAGKAHVFPLEAEYNKLLTLHSTVQATP